MTSIASQDRSTTGNAARTFEERETPKVEETPEVAATEAAKASAGVSTTDSFERVSVTETTSLTERLNVEAATDPAKVEAFAATLSHGELTQVLQDIDSPSMKYGEDVTDAAWEGLSADIERRFDEGREAIFERARSGEMMPGGIDPLDPGLVELSRQTVRMGTMGEHKNHTYAERQWRRDATSEASFQMRSAESQTSRNRFQETRGALERLTREVDLELPSALSNGRLLAGAAHFKDSAEVTDAVEGLTGLGGAKHAADVWEMEDPSALDYATGTIGAVTAPLGLVPSAVAGVANLAAHGKHREYSAEIDRRIAAGEIPVSEKHRIQGRAAPSAVDAINVAALARGTHSVVQMARRRPKAPQARGFDELPRQKLDSLELGEQLGKGAHSDVYALGDGQAVALLRGQVGKASEEVTEAVRGQLDYMAKAGDLSFEGTRIAPRIDGVVTNEQGQLIGYVMERIPGQELGDLVAQGKLSDAQFDEVVRQISGQRDALHQAGMVHGDPNLGNVLVDVLPDGQVQARLLDFEPPKPDFGVADDAQMFTKLVDEATFLRQPEQVAQFQARQAQGARKQLMAAERTNAGGMRGLLRAYRKEAPEGAAQRVADLLSELPTREARVWKPEDFQAAHRALQEAGVADWITDLDAGSELRASLESALRNWPGLAGN